MELIKFHGLPLLKFFLKTTFHVGKMCIYLKWFSGRKIRALILRGSGMGIGQLFK